MPSRVVASALAPPCPATRSTKCFCFDAIGEASVTPYARLDGGRLADQRGGQLLVALSASQQR